MKLTLILSSMFFACSLYAQSIASLQSEIVQLQKEVAALQANKALALAPFVTVDPNPQIGVIGPNITFKGANIHIVSGTGATNDNGNPTGLGNLIIGYDEAPSSISSGERGAIHSLIIGRWNKFDRSTFGGLIAGESNFLHGEGVSILGGAGNYASGTDAVVVSGTANFAVGSASSILGGENAVTWGLDDTILGSRNIETYQNYEIQP